MDETRQPGLKIAQIFLSSAHFAHRDDAMTLSPGTALDIGINVTASVQVNETGTVALITVSVNSLDEQNPLYQFRIEMTGIVERDGGNPNLTPLDYLGQQGPAMMFPFVREALANITGRGHFGPLWLAPFNIKAGFAPAQAAGAQT